MNIWKNKSGFTLLELIIVVIILGVLASIALPQFVKAVERAKGGKAVSNMSLIRKAENMYRAKNNTYLNVASDAFAASGLDNFVELSGIDADADWDYVVSGSSATAYTITATRTSPGAETVIMDQDGIITGTFTYL